MFQECENLFKLPTLLKSPFIESFDKSRDLFESLDTLIDLGVERILTSGGEDKAINGVDTIRELVCRADERIIIMPGSGVNIDNIRQIIEDTGVKEIHLSARKRR